MPGVPFSEPEGRAGRVDPDADTEKGSAYRDLEGSAPDTAVGRVPPEVSEFGAVVPRAKLLPHGKRDLADAVPHGGLRKAGPPAQGVVEAMAVTRHADQRSWVGGLAEAAVGDGSEAGPEERGSTRRMNDLPLDPQDRVCTGCGDLSQPGFLVNASETSHSYHRTGTRGPQST